MITADEFGIEDSRATVEAMLPRLLALKEQKRVIEQELSSLEAMVKQELSSNPDPLIDGETGIVATLTERRKAASIDLPSMASHPELEPLIVEAARAGVLNAALTPLRAMKGKTAWADRLLAYEMPGGVDYVLKVERGN